MPTTKIIRTSTVSLPLNRFCEGLLKRLREQEGYEVIALSSAGKDLDEVASREGVRTVAIEMYRRITNPVRDLKSLWGLVKVFRRESPTIVHSITPKAGLLSMVAAWICRVPIRIHTFTGMVFPTAKGPLRWILMMTDSITSACATHVIPEGEGVKEDLIKYHITGKPLRVLGHGNIRGINLERYNSNISNVRAEAEKIRREGIFTFIYVGRLVGDKGINELVESFSRLNKEFNNTRLLLVGGKEAEYDPLKLETLEEIVRNPAIEDLGFQDDVRPFLVASDVFVFPSYREGFPNAVIEAGAMGLPSIVTDINGSREIIMNGVNGVIIPSHSVESLYEAMKYVINYPDEVKRMANSSRSLIASRYEQGFVQQCLIDYYKEILK